MDFERSLAIRRGQAAAKARGVQLGRPPASGDLDAIVSALCDGESIGSISRRLRVSPGRVRRILRAQAEPDDGLQARARMQQQRGDRS